MNPAFIDPNNHVPDVSADDGWDNAEGFDPESKPATTVLPPRRKAADRAPESQAPAETGLRIGSNVQRSEPADTTTKLEVQEINGDVIRLEQEVPAPPKVARQITFHERPVQEKDTSRQRGEGKDWGISRLQTHHWVLGGGAGVLAIVILSLVLLPAINAPNKPREAAFLPVVAEQKDEKIEAINRMLEKQPEALQLFRAYSQASHADEIIPLIRDAAAIKDTLRTHWTPLKLSRQWAPPADSTWSVFDLEGRTCGMLEGELPDGERFSAYVTPQDGRLRLDWKATTAFSTASFSELEKGTGDPSEIRGQLSLSDYYGPVFPEQEYRSYRLVAPDRVSLIWCYVRLGSVEDAKIGAYFKYGEILNEMPGTRKITLRLERGPEGALPNQWSIGEMLHIDWVTP